MNNISITLFVLLSLINFNAIAQNKIATRWATEVSPVNVWQQYPRPQFERESWQSLNGIWDMALTLKSEEYQNVNWDTTILVPFSVESILSGVNQEVKEEEAIFYRKKFRLKNKWEDEKILLHFDAVDYEATVWLNGKKVGRHQGGYNRFTFDITKFLERGMEQELIVKAYDPQKKVFKSLGKQFSSSDQYEKCSGIWQSVWIEPVNKEGHLSTVKSTTTRKEVLFEPEIIGDTAGLKIKYEIFDDKGLIVTRTEPADLPVKISIPDPKLWSPDTPFLYTTKISLFENGKLLDQVNSYFGLRTVSMAKGQILLNGDPIFQVGPLDQNYWPWGGLTPPSEAAMLWETKYLKAIGCNMVRLHIKKNPDRFYYNCDKQGLLVWQDFIAGPWNDHNPPSDEAEAWLEEQREMIHLLFNHPSIIQWITFNESWGEHNEENILKWTRKQDSTRLITLASGWNDIKGLGDIRDLHDYTMRPAIPTKITESRAIVIGEGGGFASAVPKHNWLGRTNEHGVIKNPLFGGFNPEIPRDSVVTHDMFRPTFTTGIAFQRQYQRFIEHLILLKNSGLNAIVYTQLTDMKKEENGWLTFDREISKIDERALKKMHKNLISSIKDQTVILENSIENRPEKWLVANMPFPKKSKDSLDALTIQRSLDTTDLKWQKEFAPFGNTEGNRNKWQGKDELLAKRTFILKEIPKNLSVRIFSYLEGETPWLHCRIYINGSFVADETTRQKMPEHRMAEVIIPKNKQHVLKKGANEIMIQFIPGLRVQTGKITNLPEKISIDAEITKF